MNAQLLLIDSSLRLVNHTIRITRFIGSGFASVAETFRKSKESISGIVGREFRPEVTVGCLFSAIGGFAAAFRQEGANVLWANEKDENAVKTFRHNFPDVFSLLKPIEQVSVLEAVSKPVWIDVFTGM
ncbi:MAG: DNA cytosine methyltransferase [Planctomycetota bacterium]